MYGNLWNENVMLNAENMQEYGFSLSRIFSYKEKICPYMENNMSVKTFILTYFMQRFAKTLV